MNDKDIFGNLIYNLKIYLVDNTNTIQDQIESLNLKFSNIEYFDEITQIEQFNNSITVVNTTDDIIENELLELAKTHEHVSFLTFSKTPSKINNIINVSNLKTLDNKLLKIFKNKYKDENLILNFSDGIYYNIKQNKLFDNKNQEIHLTQRELDLLKLLLINSDQVVLHKTIQSKIWHESYEVSESAYKSLLNKLRSKIGKKSIKSISRKGYTINFQ